MTVLPPGQGQTQYDPEYQRPPIDWKKVKWGKVSAIFLIIDALLTVLLIYRVTLSAADVKRFLKEKDEACWPNVRCDINCMNTIHHQGACDQICLYDPITTQPPPVNK